MPALGDLDPLEGRNRVEQQRLWAGQQRYSVGGSSIDLRGGVLQRADVLRLDARDQILDRELHLSGGRAVAGVVGAAPTESEREFHTTQRSGQTDRLRPRQSKTTGAVGSYKAVI